MNTTPNLPTNGQNGNTKNGSAYSIQPGEVVNLGDVVNNIKKGQATGEVKQPTTYPAPKAEPAAKAPEAPQAPAPKADKPEPVAPSAPQAQLVETAAPALQVVPVRSRSEEIQFQVEKALKLQSINNQLVNLRAKLAELKQFSYRVDEDDNHNYGRLAIFDDANREFNCKHHGLSEMVVEFLMGKFEAKIIEKENELLFVSVS